MRNKKFLRVTVLEKLDYFRGLFLNQIDSIKKLEKKFENELKKNLGYDLTYLDYLELIAKENKTKEEYEKTKNETETQLDFRKSYREVLLKIHHDRELNISAKHIKERLMQLLMDALRLENFTLLYHVAVEGYTNGFIASLADFYPTKWLQNIRKELAIKKKRTRREFQN